MSDGKPIKQPPTQEEIEAALQVQAKRKLETEEKMRHATALLQGLMKKKELQRASWVMQFGYRLVQWAQMEASGVEGMNELALMMLVHAQEQATQDQGFDFDKIVADFKTKQLDWIEERLREGRARRKSREKRLKQLAGRLRRKDVPLPFHSLRVLFDEKGFSHEESLSLVGHSEGVGLVLRLIAIDYQRAGGTVLFLTDSDKPEPVHIAKQSMPKVQWINCCQILARLTETLNPRLKGVKEAPGLIIVDSLDKALAKSGLDMNRPSRLQRAFAMLKQYQTEYGFALAAGVHTDNDPEGVDPMQIYPPLVLSCPFAQVRVEKSEIVEWSRNVCIGNDTITLDELKGKVKGNEKDDTGSRV
jgi:hypothetical protein